MPAIREMRSSDRAAVSSILGQTPEFTRTEVGVAEELIDSYLAKGAESGYRVLVAEAAGEILGYVCFGPTPMTQSTWDIYWLAVSREKQGTGIGSALLAGCESRIRESGGRRAIIETSTTPPYERARRLYSHLGYESVCTIPDFYAPGDGKLILVKKL